jgi:hypothetical protein
VNVNHISLSIPLNTGVVGGIVSWVPLRLPTDISFDDFFSRVCAHMELPPLEALIGYKFSGDRKSDLAFRLANEQDLHQVMAQEIDKLKRARTKEVVIEIYNLICTSSFHVMCSNSALKATSSAISSSLWIKAWRKHCQWLSRLGD